MLLSSGSRVGSDWQMVICGTHVFVLIPTSPPSLYIPDWKKKHEISQFSEMTNSPLCTFV